MTKKSSPVKKAGMPKKPMASAKARPASKAPLKGKSPVAAKKPVAKKAASPAAKSLHLVEKKGWDSLTALRKAFLIGLGATVMTGEKLRDAVKELVDEMVARGELKPEEAKKVSEDLKRRFLESKTEVEEGIRQTVEKTRLKTLQTLEKVTFALSKPKPIAIKKPASKKPATKPAKAAAMKASKPLSATAPKKTASKAPLAKSKKSSGAKNGKAARG